MKRTSPWWLTAVDAIDKALADLPPNADKAAVVGAVREAYPFGMRKFWPYKQWLAARRKVLHLKYPAWFEGPKVKPRKPRRGAGVPGQGRLFSELIAPSNAADAA